MCGKTRLSNEGIEGRENEMKWKWNNNWSFGEQKVYYYFFRESVT